MPTNSRDVHRAARRGRHQTTAERDVWCHAPAGVASADVSADVETIAVRLVIDAATRPYRKVSRSEQEAAGLDAVRVDQVLDGRVLSADALDGQVRDVVRARAQRPTGRTRGQRVADVVCRSRRLGLDETRPMGCDGRRLAGHGPTSAAPDGPLVVAFQRNARVWSGRRLAAPRCQRRSSGRCVGAGGC
jgi:hypothetical protein